MNNRSIKFRAWDGEKMCEWDSIKRDFHSLLPPEGREVIMQFTGLKDKNGKEIYEGDIIRGVRFENVHPEQIAIVEFNDGRFQDSYWHEELKTHLGVMEIIGNIYENKNLLNQK